MMTLGVWLVILRVFDCVLILVFASEWCCLVGCRGALREVWGFGFGFACF